MTTKISYTPDELDELYDESMFTDSSNIKFTPKVSKKLKYIERVDY